MGYFNCVRKCKCGNTQKGRLPLDDVDDELDFSYQSYVDSLVRFTHKKCKSCKEMIGDVNDRLDDYSKHFQKMTDVFNNSKLNFAKRTS